MSNYFNEVAPATTSIEIKNLPSVAGQVKAAMLSYKYASSCEWYETLTKAKSVKDIFDIFNITFELKDNRFYPVIKGIVAQAGYKTLLENIAPYMNDGEMKAQDNCFIYTIRFNAGKITGSRRKIGDTAPVNPQPVQSSTPKPTTPKKPVRTSNRGNKKPQQTPPKKYGKTEVRTDTNVVAVQARDDNRYTIEEITKELIRQILNGNGGEYVEVKGDTLFKSITKTA